MNLYFKIKLFMEYIMPVIGIAGFTVLFLVACVIGILRKRLCDEQEKRSEKFWKEQEDSDVNKNY